MRGEGSRAEPHGRLQGLAPRLLACGCITSMSANMCICEYQYKRSCTGVSEAGRLNGGLGSTAPSMGTRGMSSICLHTMHVQSANIQHSTIQCRDGSGRMTSHSGASMQGHGSRIPSCLFMHSDKGAVGHAKPLRCAQISSGSPTSGSSNHFSHSKLNYTVQIISDMSLFPNPAKPLETLI